VAGRGSIPRRGARGHVWPGVQCVRAREIGRSMAGQGGGHIEGLVRCCGYGPDIMASWGLIPRRGPRSHLWTGTQSVRAMVTSRSMAGLGGAHTGGLVQRCGHGANIMAVRGSIPWRGSMGHVWPGIQSVQARVAGRSVAGLGVAHTEGRV